MIKYFKTYKEMIDKFGILLEDQWNFDKTGYCIGIGREDWVLLVDVIQRIYSKCLDNRESFTAIERINGVRRNITLIFILTGIQQPASWFNNNLDHVITVSSTETKYTNDWIFLLLVKHSEKHSAKRQQNKWHVLLIDYHGSHHKYEFLKFCEDHKIKKWVFVLIPLTLYNRYMSVISTA